MLLDLGVSGPAGLVPLVNAGLLDVSWRCDVLGRLFDACGCIILLLIPPCIVILDVLQPPWALHMSLRLLYCLRFVLPSVEQDLTQG